MTQALIQIQRDDVEHKACGSGSALAPPHACVMYCRELVIYMTRLYYSTGLQYSTVLRSSFFYLRLLAKIKPFLSEKTLEVAMLLL